MIHEIQRLLEPTATTSERTRGLLLAGFHASDLAKTTGVAVSTVRNWSSGQAEPRPDAAITLDDLRAALKVLLDGGLEPPRAVCWLTSRNSDRFNLDRPLDVLSVTPMAVLTAAHEQVIEEQVAAVPGGAKGGHLVSTD